MNTEIVQTTQNLPLQKIINFNYTLPNPYKIYTTQGSTRVLKIMVGIDNPFNDLNGNLSIGDDSNVQSLYSLSDLQTIRTYRAYPGTYFSTATNINLYLNLSNPTTGNGFIYIEEA
jgi:hypothetical protein